MKIKVMKPVYLDFEDEAGETKKYTPSPDAKVFDIDDKLAKERNYLERYKKYPDHIEIIEEKSVAPKKQKRTAKKEPEGAE